MEKSNFVDSVRRVVARIPAGSTRSYKEVAVLAGNPRAARAVARIMSNNFDANIPCHRVICANGELGGYNRGGPLKKRALLLAEGAHIIP